MSFGAVSDYFGLENTDWEMQSNGLTPEASSAQAADKFGDVKCEEEYEKTETVEVVYKCISNGTLNQVELPADFVGGKVFAFGGKSYVLTGGVLANSNGERPMLTVTGEQLHGPSDGLRLYDFASEIGEFGARKVATPIGFTLGADTLLNGCNVTFSTDVTRALDKAGAIAVLDISGGRIESTGDLISCSATPTATAAVGWTRQTPNSNNQGNTEHGTGSVMCYINMAGEEQIPATA